MLSNVHPHEDGSLIPTADDVMELSRRTPEEVLSNVVDRAPITRLPSPRSFRPTPRSRTSPRPSPGAPAGSR
jgi:hypothetical protein